MLLKMLLIISIHDIEGKANFTLGEHPTKAPDISGTANYSLGSYPKTAPRLLTIGKVLISLKNNIKMVVTA